MNIELNDFERQFLFDMLTAKKLEYKSMDIKTGTIDSVLDKLTIKPKEEKGSPIFDDSYFSELVDSPEKIVKIEPKYKLSDSDIEKLKENFNYLTQKRTHELLESLRLNIPFIKK